MRIHSASVKERAMILLPVIDSRPKEKVRIDSLSRAKMKKIIRQLASSAKGETSP